jgi:HK97 family phage major capsid protein
MNEQELVSAIEALEERARDRKFSTSERDEWHRLNEELDEFRVRRERVREVSGNPRAAISGYDDSAWTARRGPRLDEAAPQHVRAAHDGALHAIERNAGALTAAANDRLDRLVRSGDPTGIGSRYLAAVASPDYASAFGKLLAHPQDAQLHWTPAEAEAVRAVNAVMAERALAEGVGSTGGFGVSYQLDPTIVLSSNGALNPIRQLARVETISASNEWRGVSSDGVVAHWYPEGGEASDDSPTLAQPVATVRRASVFVPFSIEVGEDYTALQRELAKLIADAKDLLEAQAFLDGLAANNSPIGILAATGGLAVGQRVQTAVAATFTVGDNYLLKSGAAPRFLANATIVGSPSFFDAVYRQAGGGSTEPQPLKDRGGQWIGINKAEWSNLTYATATGSKIAILADWTAAYIIVDRVGMSIEILPHLLGSNRRPSGQRGLFAYWRVGATPLVPNAARYFEVR